MIVTQAELAKALQISTTRIAEMVKTKVIASKKVGRTRKLFEESVAASLANCRVPAKGEPSGSADIAATLPRDWLTSKEAASFIGVCDNTLRSYVSKCVVPYYRLGIRGIRFRKSELENWARAS